MLFMTTNVLPLAGSVWLLFWIFWEIIVILKMEEKEGLVQLCITNYGSKRDGEAMIVKLIS